MCVTFKYFLENYIGIHYEIIKIAYVYRDDVAGSRFNFFSAASFEF